MYIILEFSNAYNTLPRFKLWSGGRDSIVDSFLIIMSFMFRMLTNLIVLVWRFPVVEGHSERILLKNLPTKMNLIETSAIKIIKY